ANTFYWNNFTATSGLYINDTNSSNFYNTSMGGHGEGNIYANVMNGSVLINGSTSSGYGHGLFIGTNGSWPYNSTTSGNMVTFGVVDYAPLTLNNVSAPSAPPASYGGGGSSSTPVTLTSSFDCASGSVNITATASGNLISGATISLTESDNAILNRLFATTDSGGIAHFTIAASGSYSAETASGAYYGTLPSTAFDLCGQMPPVQDVAHPEQNTTPPVQNNAPPANPPVNPAKTGTNGQNENGGAQNGTYGANGSQNGQNGQGIGIKGMNGSGTLTLQQAVTEAAKPENAAPTISLAVIGGGVFLVLVLLAGYLFFVRKKK
ncbi:MAG: hypothetical protein NT051_03605, partial [Candidatus Micrarchaeota archaeon]|nr:hypothetical protein [Candidatus Micrarchaeota archaeon]